MENLYIIKAVKKLLSNDDEKKLNDFINKTNDDDILQMKLLELIYYLDPNSPLYDEKLEKDIKDSTDLMNIDFFSSQYWSKFKIGEKLYQDIEKNKVGNSNVPCPKCGKTNTNVEHKQTRSADEAMTPFYTCFNCGNTWMVKV
jgi:DNA-directed RNA polymerase subunit M/transcription elongation factor TFIIS